MNRTHFVHSALLTFLAATAAAASVDSPVPVSPGAPDRFAGVGSPCPTFSWSAVAGAEGYELVVYSAPAAGEADRASASGSEPLLRARIPAGALAWTPPVEDCLELAGSYAWLVRAVGAGLGEWSESRLFRVDVDAVLGELGPVLRRAIERETRRQEAAAAGSAALAGAPGAPADGVGSPGDSGRGPQAAASPGRRGVFTDEVELWLEESGSGPADKVQLVFATPEFDGDAVNGDAWAIVVEAEDSADPDDGVMSFSTPSFVEALQLFTDGSINPGELREGLTLRPLSAPPIACTSLQEGILYWDSSISALCACDGTSWKPVDSDNMGSCS